jgi:hypothetical protein
MANLGFKYKPGSHWTQRPENREKLMKMSQKIGKKRSHKSRAEKIVAKAVKHSPKAVKAKVEDTSIVLNGWRITLSYNSVR